MATVTLTVVLAVPNVSAAEVNPHRTIIGAEVLRLVKNNVFHHGQSILADAKTPTLTSITVA